MRTTSNAKIHTAALFAIAAMLMIPSLRVSHISGLPAGAPPFWYWTGFFLPLACGLISFFGGMYVFRRKSVDPISKCTLWVGFFGLYFLLLLLGGELQQAIENIVVLSVVILYGSRFLIPLVSVWLLGVKPAILLALLPAVMRLSNLAYFSDSAGYIVLSAMGGLLSVAVFTVEVHRLIGGGQLSAALTVLCALADAILIQAVFNSVSACLVVRSITIGAIQFLPLIAVSVVLHFIAKRRVIDKPRRD